MTPPPPSRAWWEGRPYALLLIMLSAVPLIWPPIPPITDLLGHLGRYRVQLDLATSPYLAQYFGFKWAIVANLGVDALVQLLAPWMGLEPAVKLIVLMIPPITVAGLIGIAREVHGRVPATAAFALPLAWGYPFQLGFVNFALSMGLAMCAFALWLRLGRLGWRRPRSALFVAVGIVLWFAHLYGWGVLGLLVFSAELVACRRRGDGPPAAIWRAGLATWPLWPPILLVVAWHGQGGDANRDWFEWLGKFRAFIWILRERWSAWDMAGAALLCGLPVIQLAWRRSRVDPVLALATAVLAITFVILPRALMTSYFADTRLAPTVVMCAVLAFNPSGFGRRGQAAWAVAATSFFLARVAVSTWAFALYSLSWQAQLPALDHVARGSRVLALAYSPCTVGWREAWPNAPADPLSSLVRVLTFQMDASSNARDEHVSSLATTRREAFVNGQWAVSGAQLLTIHYGGGGERYTYDRSQIARPGHLCNSFEDNVLEQALRDFPRDAFDYVWLINLPPSRRPVDRPELVPLWFGEKTGALYRVDHSVSGTPRSD